MQNEINIRLIFSLISMAIVFFLLISGNVIKIAGQTSEPKTADESGNTPEVIEILEKFIAAIGGRKATS